MSTLLVAASNPSPDNAALNTINIDGFMAVLAVSAGLPIAAAVNRSTFDVMTKSKGPCTSIR
jgi:hypothetical protein